MSTISNSKRNLVRIVYDIANYHGITIDSFSYDWILKLSKNNIHKHIFGYNFELNLDLQLYFELLHLYSKSKNCRHWLLR